jgi:hypothetical protein
MKVITAKELIEELQKFDPNAEVRVKFIARNGNECISHVTDVKFNGGPMIVSE